MLALLMAALLQDQTAEAKKVLDAVLPLKKEQAYLQLEVTTKDGDYLPFTKTLYFKRGKAWRSEYPGGFRVYDGTYFWDYQAANKTYSRLKGDPYPLLMSTGGILAELCMYGTADRMLKEMKQVTVRKEILDGNPCTQVILTMKAGNENHGWIDANRKFLQGRFKSPSENTLVTYKFVDPPATDDKLFTFTPPADSKDITAPADR